MFNGLKIPNNYYVNPSKYMLGDKNYDMVSNGIPITVVPGPQQWPR